MKNFSNFLIAITLLTIGLFPTVAQSRVLDKILAVINDNVITLSMVKRVQNTITARAEILPLVYKNKKYSQKEIVEIMIQRVLIREKIEELRYIVSDDQVESQIKSREKMLGVTRDALLQFLSSKGMTFDEYFELTRETIEFNIFTSRIITPLISISDQEIKNRFFKENIKNKTLSFKYTLVDFSMDKKLFTKKMLKNFKNVLKKFQSSGVLPKAYSSLSTNVLGDITEDGLTNKLKNILKRTDEGSFSKSILLYDQHHIFFVKKKDLVESDSYQRSKQVIKNKIMSERMDQVTDLWFNRESNKHYVKLFFKK
jgi:peptidyl-prolyl cis-trans isomerase SurA